MLSTEKQPYVGASRITTTASRARTPAKRAVFRRGTRRVKDGGDSEFDKDDSEVAILKANKGVLYGENSALLGRYASKALFTAKRAHGAGARLNARLVCGKVI